MTVIEVRGRGGQLLERHRTWATEVRVGRALDNDLILEDEYVSPHHLRLRRAEDGWRFEDLDSLNGVQRTRGISPDGTLRSGAEIQLGQTTLHVYEDTHEAAPARPLDNAEERLAGLGEPRVWLGLGIALCVLLGLSMFWSSITEFKVQTVLSPIAGELLYSVGIAGAWALVSRLLRHKAHFGAHLSIWLVPGVATPLALFLAAWAGYNLGSARVEAIVASGLDLLATSLAIWASLTLATPLHQERRIVAAVGTALVLLGLDVVEELQWESEFSSHPDYYARVLGPSLLWASARPEEALNARLPALFEQADREAQDADEAEDDPTAPAETPPDTSVPEAAAARGLDPEPVAHRERQRRS